MRHNRGAPDFLLFLAVFSLVSLGVVMVFSASAYDSLIRLDDRFHYLKRQLSWAAIGLTGLLTTMQYDYRRYRRWAGPVLITGVILLILVLLVGISAKGASRALGVGFLSFQPSEVIKLALVLFLAKNLSERQPILQDFRRGVLPHLLLLAFICALILAQPDLGTAVTIAGTTYLLLLAAGARARHLILLAALGVVVMALAIALEPYRMRRFLSFLDPYADPEGAGFQIIQGLLALGSGGFFGVGLGNSKQKLLYIPERHTDFIYTILGEELGFLGAALVLVLLFIIVWRGIRAAVVAPDTFGTLLAAGLTCAVALQAIINIGVVTGSLPVTGITLPFLSYGGSSLIFSLLGMGIVLNISRFATRR